MTAWLITNETPHPYPGLTRQLIASATRVAGHVTDVTGLPLPPHVRLRLLTPTGASRAFRLAWEARTRNFSALAATPGQHATLRLSPLLFSACLHAAWPRLAALTLTGPDGIPEIAFLPRAMAHMDLTTPVQLDAVTAHELCHVAQLTGAPNLLRDLLAETLLAPETSPDRAFSHAAEGHATWGQRRVTGRLHNTPVTRLLGSGASRRAHRTGAWLERSKLLGDPARYEQGYRFVTAVEEEGGTALVNRLWEAPAALPTYGEIAAPEAWAARIHQSTL